MDATLPGSRVLVVENESSLYQLPQVSGTIAILGAGLNLGWLEAPGFDGKQLAYWGDLDTWGLQMLAAARRYRPQLRALLMTRDIFDAPCGAVGRGRTKSCCRGSANCAH
jgi:hypothetical protein